jgi:hypothetical protein
MASWAAVLAWTGFRWSGVTGTMRFAAREGRWFWSNGRAWGTCEQQETGDRVRFTIAVLYGVLTLSELEVTGVGAVTLDRAVKVQEGENASWCL